MNLADNGLNLHRIDLTVYTDNYTHNYTDNEVAIALCMKFGFAIEGRAVDYAFRNGNYVNAYCMA